MSANGANHKLWAKRWIHPLFYSKTMGEKEQTILSNHSFKYTSINKYLGLYFLRLSPSNT